MSNQSIFIRFWGFAKGPFHLGAFEYTRRYDFLLYSPVWLAFVSIQVSSLVSALKALILRDKAWVRTALDHLRTTLFGDCAGGRVTPDAAAAAAAGVGVGVGANDQRRRLFGFDLGKSVGLELAPSMQMLAELLLCSQGEEVRGVQYMQQREEGNVSFFSKGGRERKALEFGVGKKVLGGSDEVAGTGR